MPPALKDAIVEGATDWLTVFPDGRVYRDPDVTVTEDQYQQMWQGYMCASCYEPLSPPFPEVCTLPGCGFRVRDEQRRYMTERFDGYRWIGPSKETVERISADDEKLDWASKPRNPRIWVPGAP